MLYCLENPLRPFLFSEPQNHSCLSTPVPLENATPPPATTMLGFAG